MLILRNLIISFFCICYVTCQASTNGSAEDIAFIFGAVADKTKDLPDYETSTLPLPHAAEGAAEECSADDGQLGTCVKESLCSMPKSTENIITDRMSICRPLQVCCPKSYIQSDKVPPKLVQPDYCGMSNPGAEVFRDLPDENYSDFAEFPWMVALLRRGTQMVWSTKDLIGGGSLIHKSVVITNAFKIRPYYHTPNKIKCRAGEWEVENENEIMPYEERSVKKFVVHDDYMPYTRQYNVALVILSEPFNLTANIGIACLGNVLPTPGTECFGMGWGQDVTARYKYVYKLKKVKLPFVDEKECQNNLRKTKLGPTFELHSTLMCAGGEEGVDMCVGDGGSPLVCPINNPGSANMRYAVFGMVAYGVGCGVKNVPGVYVNIPSVYTWVMNQMVHENFSNSQFVY